jgi:hypothetical protein
MARGGGGTQVGEGLTRGEKVGRRWREELARGEEVADGEELAGELDAEERKREDACGRWK